MESTQHEPGITPPVPESSGAHHFSLGDRQMHVFTDGTFDVPPNFLSANAPPKALADALTEAGFSPSGYALPIHNLLIEAGDQLVLVDVGYGSRFQSTRPNACKLLPAMRAAGILPSQITTVLLTHMHPDHAAGAIDAEGQPAFPNARYLVNRVEYDFWWGEPSLNELVFPEDRKQFVRQTAKDVLSALRGRIEKFEPGDKVAPGVSVIAAPGHTPGHVALELAGDGERMLHVADAAANPVLNLHHPDWFFGFDNWPCHAIKTRRLLFDRAATENLLVMAAHFPFPGLGHVTQDGDRWRWHPVV